MKKDVVGVVRNKEGYIIGYKLKSGCTIDKDEYLKDEKICSCKDINEKKWH